MIEGLFTDVASLQMAVEQSMQSATHIVLALTIMVALLLAT